MLFTPTEVFSLCICSAVCGWAACRIAEFVLTYIEERKRARFVRKLREYDSY